MFRDRLSKYIPVIKADIFHGASVTDRVSSRDLDVWLNCCLISVDYESAIADNRRENIGSFDIANVLRELLKFFQG